MNKLARTYWTLRALGWDNVPRRVWQVAKGKLGVHQRTLPGGELSPERMQANFVVDYRREDAPAHWRRRAGRFFLTPDRLNLIRAALPRIADEARWREYVGKQAAELHRGRMLFFSHHWVDVGWPVKFNRDPMHGVDWPTGKHWSTYKQFDPALDDIKCVWEASRFAWAFALGRQHVRDPKTAFPDAAGQNPLRPAELFWQTFEQWDQQNTYGLTPNWVCGQEATFRLFACLFASATMIDDPASTPARLARLTEVVWYIARHIEGNINYARGQKNNHAISEAVGMYTIGRLFPEFARAERWCEQGRRVLGIELGRQIYDDGSFVQHSTNYHRLMMQDVSWALAVAQAAGDELPPTVRDRATRALNWLIQMIDPRSGGVPNYGHNDGALILPLSCCDYTEFRPVAQASALLLHGQPVFEPGPWDEEGLWLGGGNDALEATSVLDATVDAAPNELRVARASTVFPDGGYYTFKGPRSWAMIRSHTYRDRPAHSDMLHFDLWYEGVNVLCDGGTFAYYCPQPWQHWNRSTRAHNTVEVDGLDQMVPGPNFLWLRWSAGTASFRTAEKRRVDYFIGVDKSYRRSEVRAAHVREVWRLDDTYVVRDNVQPDVLRPRDVALRWRLGVEAVRTGEAWRFRAGNGEYELRLILPNGVAAREATGESSPAPAGWRSRYYGERSPATTIEATGRLTEPEFLTIIRPVDAPFEVTATPTGNGEVGTIRCSDPRLQAGLDELATALEL